MTHDDFIATMLPTAIRYERTYAIPAEALIAINISETNWGAAGSLFGIKGSGTAGSITYQTWENYGPGREHTVINDQFAAYKTVDDAYADFIRFIQIGRYIPAWNAFQQTKDWRELIRGINRAGYATDPNWATMIIALSETVKKSPAFKDVKMAPQDGWQKKGKQQILVNEGVEVLKIGDEAGQFPGRIAKNFGGEWFWLRRGTVDQNGEYDVYFSPKEGD